MGRGPGVRATSASSIGIDFVYKGVRCRERISLPPTPANLKYAKRLKATIDHEIATNTFDYAKHFPDSPRARRVAAGPSVTLRSALLAYVDSLAGQIEPETLEEYRNDAERVARDIGADKPLPELTRADVRTWVSQLNLSKKRIDNLLVPLRGALDQAVEDEVIKGNPLSGFKVRRVGKPQDTIDPFSPAEIALLAKTELGSLWEWWAWTGPRTEELIGFQWQDVSPDSSLVWVQRAIRVGRIKVPKTNAGRRCIRLLPRAREILAAMTRGDPAVPLFINPNTGAHWYEDRALARAFRKACEAAKVRYRYPYQLRHTFATWALSSGENPAWIARHMGHADTMMLFRVYGKWMPSLDPQAGSRMTKAAKVA